MKTALVFLCLAAVLACNGVTAQSWYRRAGNYARDFAGGARDMWRAYR